ncbi:MAG: energy transducer TonB [Marinilabiliaceae bacterium]|nr:energy transducer TonB [Marinilabiliaceae bacterium]
MEIKKSSKADLENKKTVFMQIGVVIVLSIALIAFEWSTTDYSLDPSLVTAQYDGEEEIIPITKQEEVKPPPPPPPQVTDILNIVEDDVELDDVLDIFDTEMDDVREFDMTISMEMEEEERDDTEIFTIVEESPEFPGGEAALLRYLAQNTKYPPIAQENNITGRVMVQFVVEPTGDVSNVKVMRPVDPSLDREAIRVVQSLPRFKPGKQRNRPVRVYYTVPINFTLQNQ